MKDQHVYICTDGSEVVDAKLLTEKEASALNETADMETDGNWSWTRVYDQTAIIARLRELLEQVERTVSFPPQSALYNAIRRELSRSGSESEEE